MADGLKFAAEDARYLSERKLVSEAYGPRELWSVIDHWPLYVGVSNLARCLAIYEILKEQASVPGDIAEFGSWRGANLMFMAKVMAILDPLSGKQVHCFESFEGLSTFTPQDGDDATRGAYKGSQKELEDLIALYQLGDTIKIHKGWIDDTLPAWLATDAGQTLSLAYFDADLYAPAVTVLTQCHERMAKGGVFVFDEWNYPAWPGEGLAVREFMEKHGEAYDMVHVPKTRQPSLVLRRIR